jgi:type I restriction enzyme S subunit
VSENQDEVRSFRQGKLPPNWTLATLAELVAQGGVFSDGDWVESKDQDPKGDVRLIQLADVGDGTYRDRSNRYLTYEKALELRCTFLKPVDVLIARMPDPLGRACIFPGDRKKAVTVVDVCVVRPSNTQVDSKWLMHFLNAPQFRARVASYQSGSTRKRISRKNLSRIRLPVPPFGEQLRIVQKIEELFTKLDAGANYLRAAQTLLRRYRQSVLTTAVDGTLSKDWRDAHSLTPSLATHLLERIIEHRKHLGNNGTLLRPKGGLVKLLPQEWTWTSVDQVSHGVRYGSSRKTNEDPSGIPVLRMGNIVDGKLRFDSLKYLPDSHDEFPDLLLEQGDILFNRTNSYDLVGKTAVYRGGSRAFSFASYLIRLRLVDGVVPDFVAYYINSSYGRAWISSVVSQQVGQANVNGTKLKSLAIPLPSTEEQEFIVSEVERRLSVIEALEDRALSEVLRSSRLRQSILGNAFSGKLVPQDPSDEPASFLTTGTRTSPVAAKT